MARQKSLLPEGYADDEPIQIEYAEDGFVVGVPYDVEGSDVPRYRKKSCLGVNELCFHLKALFGEIDARRKAERQE